MTSAQLYRLSGLGLLVGAAVSALATVLSGILFPDSNSPATITNPLNISLGVLGAIGAMFALFGLPALYLRSAREGGVVWLLGVVLIALTGALFGIFASLTFALIIPALATRVPGLLAEGPPPGLIAVFIVGTIANVLGALLMGIPMLTRRIYPRWCAYLMMIEAVLAAISFLANGPGPTSLFGQILTVISPLPLFAVLGWAGYQLWTGKPASSEAPAGTVSVQPA